MDSLAHNNYACQVFCYINCVRNSLAVDFEEMAATKSTNPWKKYHTVMINQHDAISGALTTTTG